MAEVSPYYKFLKDNLVLGQERFLAKFKAPFLHFQNLPDLEISGMFTTIKVTSDNAPPEDLCLQGILSIEKGQGSNAFGMMITMGRAKNNDLVIPDKRVSKFHAYFRESGGSWSLTDANSTNGSSVNGVMLKPQQAHPLQSGAKIQLSKQLDIVFLTPADLLTRMQAAKAWSL